MIDDEDDDRFIDGIFNYCDRWCERCPFTSRCRLFEMDQELSSEDEATASRDSQNAEFWQTLHNIFLQTKEMLREMAREQGIDVDELEPDPEYERLQEERERRLEENELVQSAHDYHRLADGWFEERPGRFEEKGEELSRELLLEVHESDPEAEAVRIADAVDVIRWYEYQIAVKLTRAAGQDLEDDWDEDDDPVQNDANGSAKVALLGMDRSLAAWSILRDTFPAEADSILDLMIHLGRLRTATEREFPHARAFVRPGFDTELPHRP